MQQRGHKHFRDLLWREHEEDDSEFDSEEEYESLQKQYTALQGVEKDSIRHWEFNHEPPTLEDFGDKTPQLDEAVRNGDLGTCQTLVEQWKLEIFPVPITPCDLSSALVIAAGSKHPHIAAYLLKQGAVITEKVMGEAFGETDDAIAMFQTFLDHGWNINMKTRVGDIMLKHVLGDETLTRWFLSHGANPTVYGEPGATMLDVAAAQATPAAFDLLRAYGCRLEDSDALHSAAGEREGRPGRVEMMAHLLDLDMDINALGKRDHPLFRLLVLHAAVASQRVDRIAFCLDKGADIQAKNAIGQTALQYAEAFGFRTSEVYMCRRFGLSDDEEAAALSLVEMRDKRVMF